jgi:cytoskeletal protein CcmA (bactofilin family)
VTADERKNIQEANEKVMSLMVEKKTLRSDIPGHSAMLTGTMPYNTATATEEPRRLIVGRDICLSGEISSCDHLVVEGRVVASDLQVKRFDILEAGVFEGTATVQDAVVAGRFNGQLVVLGRLTVKSTGRIQGEIEYGALEVEAGSRMEARITARAQGVEEKKAPVEAHKMPRKSETSAPAAADAGETTEERPDSFRRAVGF